ncbi:F-box domain containing protein [Trypanosoma brucei equiperdum]|uniref:F-box domain containing protein n=1 Tax=Trypanosoma brucei equiperdum TaxID=630700 RepID=A0A3L6L173_9TRYP|nr:F-box domain containing protein [Trypanosoma brucei equiperdum]
MTSVGFPCDMNTSSSLTSLANFYFHTRNCVDKNVRTTDRSRMEFWVQRLPTVILQEIFMEVIRSDGFCFAWVGILSSVCRSWYCACQHPVMWAFMAKKVFVAYPLVLRAQAVPEDKTNLRMRSVSNPIIDDADDFGTVSNSRDAMELPTLMTNQSLRRAIEDVRLFDERRSYHTYVRQIRVLVLGMMLSGTLLLFSMFLFITVCVLEGIKLGGVFTTYAALSFLWATYWGIFTIIIANIVMEAHFEPAPLFPRLRKNKPLILTSTAILLIGLFTLVLPTLLVHINLTREEKFSWMWCGATPLLFLLSWQLCVVLSCFSPSKWGELLRSPHVVLRPMKVVMSLILNIPHAFPFCCAVALYSLLQYIQYGGRTYLLVAVFPLLASLPILSTLLLLDFYMKRQMRDLLTGVSLLLASIFPLSLFWTDFRGFSLLPLAAASLLLFITHFRQVAQQSMLELVEEIQRNRRPARWRRSHSVRM